MTPCPSRGGESATVRPPCRAGRAAAGCYAAERRRGPRCYATCGTAAASRGVAHAPRAAESRLATAPTREAARRQAQAPKEEAQEQRTKRTSILGCCPNVGPFTKQEKCSIEHCRTQRSLSCARNLRPWCAAAVCLACADAATAARTHCTRTETTTDTDVTA